MSTHITVTPSTKHVRVIVGGQAVLDTTKALELKEGSSPVVLYLPIADAMPGAFAKTATTSHCPYKGDASYWTITAGGKTAKDAAWGYEHPKADVSAIAGHVAFYPNRVDAIEMG